MKRIFGIFCNTPVRRFVLGSPPLIRHVNQTTCQSGNSSYHNIVAHRLSSNAPGILYTQRNMTSGAGRNVDLTYEDIVDLKAKNVITLVDVREHNEIQETGKLPGSIHIPLGELMGALQAPAEEFQSKYGCTQPGKDAELVFSCKSGNRSRRALNAAVEAGFKNSRHYIGGFTDWQEKTK